MVLLRRWGVALAHMFADVRLRAFFDEQAVGILLLLFSSELGYTLAEEQKEPCTVQAVALPYVKEACPVVRIV